MALTPTIYRVSLDLSHVDRDIYAKLTATVARHPSETAERLVLRLLAYGLCYEEGLVFTRGISAGDEPDLWSKEPDGRVDLWLEVGLPEPERLLKMARHARRVVLLAAGAQRWRWESSHLAKCSALPNLTVFGLDAGFVQQLAGRLERAVVWSLTISDGVLYLTDNDLSLETPVEVLAGPGFAAPERETR